MTPETFPETVRIGEFTYDIRKMDAMTGMKHGYVGWHHGPSLEIMYQENMPNRQIAHTLMHEVLHGLWFVGNLRDDENRDQEEAYVTRLTHLLCQFIQNNPHFLAWLSQTFTDSGTQRVLTTARTPEK